MKSVIGFLMLLFSATTALATDYQIISTEYSQIDFRNYRFSALVVDVTSGPVNVCNGTLYLKPTSQGVVPEVSVACSPTKLHGVTAMPSGPATLSTIQIPGSQATSYLLYPSVWKASAGIVTFCSNSTSDLLNLYCATTNLG
jgi:hypothetical protein